MATLADIKDFKALEQWVGNLATIQANKFDLTSWDLKERYNSIAVAGSEKNTADLIQINTTVSNEILETYPKSDPSNPDNDERSALCLGASSAQQWWDAVPLGRENCIESNISFLADYSKNDSNLYGSWRTNGITNSGFPSIDNGGIKIENNNEYIKYNLTNIGDLKGGKITIYFTNDIPILPAWSPIRYVFGDGNNKWRMGIKANKDVVITRPAGDIGWTGSCIGAICYFQFGGIVAPENPLVLWNYYRSSQNDYPGPIKSTIKSINISNP